MKKQTKGTDKEIVRTTIRVPRDVLDKAKIQAIKEQTSLQDLIIKALQSYMKGVRTLGATGASSRGRTRLSFGAHTT